MQSLHDQVIRVQAQAIPAGFPSFNFALRTTSIAILETQNDILTGWGRFSSVYHHSDPPRERA
jgi:hypothetical protein